jgi:hypothetical protein
MNTVSELYFTETKLKWPTDRLKWYEPLKKISFRKGEDEKTFNIAQFNNFIPKDLGIKLLIDDYNLSARLFRLEPDQIYSWHLDRHRKWALNMIFVKDESVTLFSPRSEFDEDQGFSDIFTKKRFINPVYRLQYDPGTFYLINGHEPHMVYSGTSVRFLLTVSHVYRYVSEEDNDASDESNLSYQQMRQLLIDKNLI